MNILLTRTTPNRRFLFPLLSMFIMCCVLSCSPTYVIQAGWQEAVILAKREDIKDVIVAPETPALLKTKLLLVQAAQAFSTRIELDTANSYTTYSKLDRDELVWVVSAAPQFSLDTYTWWFPIVGSFPYKGFFDKEDALKESEKLASKNYDTYVRHSPAFSTLGWFNDPLLSTITNYESLTLLEIVFHEMVHSTIWFPDKASFNETLANVVSFHALEAFLNSETQAILSAGIGRDEIATMLQEVAQRRTLNLLFANLLQHLKIELEKFYQTLPKGLETSHIAHNSALETKTKIFTDHLGRWKDVINNTKPRSAPKPPSNNAMLVANLTYYDRPAKLECLYLQSGNVPNYLRKLKELQHTALQKETSIEEVIEAEINKSALLCSTLEKTNYYSLIASDCPCSTSM